MRRVIPAAIAVLAVILVVLIARGDDDKQTVRVELLSAGGLREGSDVKVAGVTVGKIGELKLDKEQGDKVLAELEVDREKAQVGPDGRVEIVTRNLLGSKFVSVNPGKPKGAPGTVTVPASRVGYPVDVDEVLDTLDAGTRTRLQIMLNELGYALTGRKADFSAALRLLPQDLDAGSRLLAEVASDNRTLRGVVEHTGSAVQRIAQERKQLGRFIDVAGAALETTAGRRAQLAATLDRAPATLRSAQTFLGQLEATTKPLAPAARTISATAPALNRTLAELEPFERAARPTLTKAQAIAPALTKLGAQATPVLRRARPALASLSEFSSSLVPVTRTLDVSIDDLLGLIEGWARAIQTRDGFSHLFRGRATVGPEFFRSLIQSSGGPDLSPPSKSAEKRENKPASKPAPEAEKQLPPVKDLVEDLKLPGVRIPQLQLDKLPPAVDQLLDDLGLKQQQQQGAGSTGQNQPITPLLDFLFGK